MSHEFENHEPQELKAVEQALAAVAPAAPRLDRDRLMFLAGAASAQASGGREPPEAIDANLAGNSCNATEGVPYNARTRRGLFWPAATTALAATSLALAIALLNRPAPAEKIVYRDREVLVAAAAPNAPSSVTPQTAVPKAHGGPFLAAPAAVIPADNYVRTRDVALRLGLDALGTRPAVGGSAESPAPTYRSLMEALSPESLRPSAPTNETSQM